MLRNRYYLGIVTFKGVEYAGTHEPLIDEQTFQAVGDILDERAAAREKLRTHRHYLTGTIYCARCKRRLCFTRSTGKGNGKYDYFFCTNRRDGTCDQAFLSIGKIEEQILDLYKRVHLPPEFVDGIREQVREQMESDQADLDRQVRKRRGKRKALDDAHRRLLDAYLEGLVSMDDFKTEQRKLKRQIASIDNALSVGRARWEDIQTHLAHALAIAAHCETIYAEADSATRRLLNQGLYSRIYVDSDAPTSGEPTEVFEALLDPEVRQNANRTHPHARRCVNESLMAPPTGFEPVLPA
jgi:hypothetical protein